MMSGSDMWGNPWTWVFVPLVVALGVALVALLVGAFSQPAQGGAERSRGGRVAATAVAVAVLVVATVTVGIVAASSTSPRTAVRSQPSCSAPGLPGATVDVTLADMGGSMGERMPTWSNGQLMPGTGQGMMGMGGGMPYRRMMSVMVSPSSVAAGTVSFRVWNAGTLVHELVVMPMPAGGIGTRAVGTDGKVSEEGSLGEASNTCGEGTGEGIEPNAQGWVTLQLEPGSYELICNLAGHYAMGMFTELTVT
jgi:uncharacterized cupredoxin-like copper-binding protein